MGPCNSKSKKQNPSEEGNPEQLNGYHEHTKEDKFTIQLKEKLSNYKMNKQLEFDNMNQAGHELEIINSPIIHDFTETYFDCVLIAQKTEVSDFKESTAFVQHMISVFQKNELECPEWDEYLKRNIDTLNIDKISEVFKLIQEKGNSMQMQELSYAIKLLYLNIRSKGFYDSVEKTNNIKNAESELSDKINELYFFFYQDDIKFELDNIYNVAFEEADAYTEQNNENPVDHSGGIIDNMILNVKNVTNKILAF